MARSKSLDNIDVDKLLEIVTAPRKVKPSKAYPEIDQFILETNVTVGKRRIPTHIIYYTYAMWKKTRLVPRLKFINYFKTKFTKVKTDHGIGFLLSIKGFDLSPQGFFKARAFLRKERHEKELKKKKI